MLDVKTDYTYTVPMMNDMNDREPMFPKRGERRAYGAPSLTVHGQMTELTKTGNGNGKETAMSNFRPVTLSNP